MFAFTYSPSFLQVIPDTLSYIASSLICPLSILPCSPTHPSLYREIKGDQGATPRSGPVRWNLRNLGKVSGLESGAHKAGTGGLPTFSPAWIFRDTPCTAMGSSGRCLSPKSRNSICPPQGQRGWAAEEGSLQGAWVKEQVGHRSEERACNFTGVLLLRTSASHKPFIWKSPQVILALFFVVLGQSFFI